MGARTCYVDHLRGSCSTAERFSFCLHHRWWHHDDRNSVYGRSAYGPVLGARTSVRTVGDHRFDLHSCRTGFYHRPQKSFLARPIWDRFFEKRICGAHRRIDFAFVRLPRCVFTRPSPRIGWLGCGGDDGGHNQQAH